MTNEIIRNTSEIIPVIINGEDYWVNIILAAITFFAVFVALFQERIRKWWNRSVLDMEISLAPPDCHQIAMSDKYGKIIEKTIYLRIKVIHKRGAAGENVEIMPIKFWSIDDNNNLSIVKHFLPINLVWSHFQPRTNITRIPVGLFRHCDFGHLICRGREQEAVLVVDTLTQPNPVANEEIPNVIRPGKYKFELLLSGDNVRAVRKTWEIKFKKWSEDENEMLNENIELKLIK